MRLGMQKCREKLTQKEVDYNYLKEKVRKLQFKLSYLKRKFDSQKTKKWWNVEWNASFGTEN